MKININDIEVKIKLLDKSKTLAQAELIICEQIELKGWRVSVSNRMHEKFQEMIWIQPPSYKSSQGYKPMIFIDDKKLYEQVEEKIYDEYSKKRQQEGEYDQVGDVEDISGDIPF